MDELFQKAAENYPLKTNTGNFDDLAPFIGSETTTPAKPAFSKGKRNTALLLLAFLFTGFTIATTYIITKNNNGNTINTTATVKDKSISPNQNNTVPVEYKSIAAPVDAVAQKENTGSSSMAAYQKDKLAAYTKGNMFIRITSPAADTDEDSKKITDQPGNVKPVDDQVLAKNTDQQMVSNDMVTTEDKKDNIDKVEKKKESTPEETKTADKKDKKNKDSNKPRLYYGIAAGAELNEVKGQHMTNTGLNGGIILGLQINKKTAIETGVQVSQKKYYSDGKYFKPKAGSMPANMLVKSLQSTSTIIEIPVSVKYNFSKKKNTLYGKAGVSSYIMTKESNQYQAEVSGQQQEINSTYKANHGYLASDIRISAGYQHTAGKKLNIRLEPFIQIPLRGIGIGALPVTTAGMQIVLTRN